MTDDRTALQTLIQKHKQVDQVIADLTELEDEYSDETKEWQMSIVFSVEDIPTIVSELEELTDE